MNSNYPVVNATNNINQNVNQIQPKTTQPPKPPAKAPNKNKIWIIIAVIATILISGGGTYFYFLKKNASEKPETNVKVGASLALLEGTIEYQSADGTWQTASKGQDFYEGYSVKVSGEGRAVINLDDGSAVRLDSNSSVTLKSMAADRVIILNNGGEVYNRIVKITDRKFYNQIGQTNYESIGTAFRTINQEGQNGVDVFASSIHCIGQDKKEITIEEGYKYFDENTKNSSQEKKLIKISIEDLKKDDFILWNLKQDLSNSDFDDELGVLAEIEKPQLLSSPTPEESATPTSTPTVVVTSESKLTLTGRQVDSGVYLEWTAENLDVKSGFKVLKSKNANPVFPGDSYQYLNSASARSYTWEITDGVTYHFRVCQYTGSACGKYSNDITVTAPKIEASPGSVTAITLSQSSGANVVWTVTGTAPLGFKLVWSANANPIYPPRGGDEWKYLSSSSATSGSIDETTGTYYIRVCEYLGSSCGVYSNQITVSL